MRKYRDKENVPFQKFHQKETQLALKGQCEERGQAWGAVKARERGIQPATSEEVPEEVAPLLGLKGWREFSPGEEQNKRHPDQKNSAFKREHGRIMDHKYQGMALRQKVSKGTGGAAIGEVAVVWSQGPWVSDWWMRCSENI